MNKIEWDKESGFTFLIPRLASKSGFLRESRRADTYFTIHAFAKYIWYQKNTTL